MIDMSRIARFTDRFADAGGGIGRLRPTTTSDAVELAVFAVLGLAAAIGIVVVGVWMVQRGNWAYLPLLLAFFVVPVAVWRVR
jgi:hypothetical protein